MSRATADRGGIVRANLLRMQAAAADLAATMVEASAALRDMADSLEQSFEEEFVAHPDLAEMNVILDGYYAP